MTDVKNIVTLVLIMRNIYDDDDDDDDDYTPILAQFYSVSTIR